MATAQIDILTMTVKQLKQKCKDLKIRRYSKAKKSELQYMITNYNKLSEEDKKKTDISPQTKLYNECKKLIKKHKLDIKLIFLHQKGSSESDYQKQLLKIKIAISNKPEPEPEEKKEPEPESSPYYIDNSDTKVYDIDIKNETEEAKKILIATNEYKKMDTELLESIIEKFNMNNFSSLIKYIKLEIVEEERMYALKIIKKLKKRKKYIKATLFYRKNDILKKRHKDKMIKMAEIQLKKRHSDKMAKMEKLRLEHAKKDDEKIDILPKAETNGRDPIRTDIRGIPNIIPSPKSSPLRNNNFRYPNNPSGIGFDKYGRYLKFFTDAMKEVGKKFKTYEEAKDEITRIFVWNFDFRNDPEEYENLMSKIKEYHKTHGKLFTVLNDNRWLNIELRKIEI